MALDRAERAERDRTIVQQVAAGMKRKDAAKLHGLTIKWVNTVMVRAVGRKKPPLSLPSATIARIKALAEQGMTIRQIALDVGVGLGSVSWAVKKYNILLKGARGPRAATKVQREAATILVGKGWTYGQAAVEVGLSRNAVAGAVHRASRQTQP